MKCKLTPGLSSGDWNEFCSRFHFPPDDLPHIQAIYTALLPLVESYAYYSLDQDLDGVSLPHYAYGFVTLGNGVDELSELYLNHEQIQEAYIVDCISLMLLSKAYEEFAHVVERQSRLYLAELSFLGDTYSLNLLPQIYKSLAPPISSNYVIRAQTAGIFPARREKLRLRTCHILMEPCRYSIQNNYFSIYFCMIDKKASSFSTQYGNSSITSTSLLLPIFLSIKSKTASVVWKLISPIPGIIKSTTCWENNSKFRFFPTFVAV